MNQQQIRKAKRQQRKDISKEQKVIYSRQVMQKIMHLEQYKNAKNIAGYLAMPEELQLDVIISSSWQIGKNIFLPVVIANKKPLLFAKYKKESILTKGSLGINIPVTTNADYVDAKNMDLVITPLVAFDEECNRIGMGGGFYDRTFSFVGDSVSNTFLVGVAFDEQQTEKIEANRWDVKPDLIITPSNIFKK